MQYAIILKTSTMKEHRIDVLLGIDSSNYESAQVHAGYSSITGSH